MTDPNPDAKAPRAVAGGDPAWMRGLIILVVLVVGFVPAMPAILKFLHLT